MSKTNVVTGLVRFSYAHVFEPTTTGMSANEKPKYSISLIIPKSDTKTVNDIKTAIAEVMAEKFKAGERGVKNPLRDGDTDPLKAGDPVYADSYFLNASSLYKPGVLNNHHQQIIDPEEFYSGCYGYASINFYGFNVPGNKGVACGLNNLMKWKDGEKLGGGKRSAEDDFASLPTDNDAPAFFG